MGILRELRIELSAMIFGAGIILVFIGSTQYVPPLHDWARGTVLQSILESLGPWIFWEAVLAVLVVLGGGWYFVDTVRKEREFNRLIATTSKESFLKNRKRLEYLGYVILPSSYERRVVKKKQEFKVKD